MVSAIDLAEGERRSKQQYDMMMREIIKRLSERYRPDSVNLLMAHTHLHGALYSGSEREVHLGEGWATEPRALPSSADYVALGHIHRPQRVEASPAPAAYAGSPLQLDFGEEDETKTFVLIEASPHKQARLDWVPYEGGRRLCTVRAPLVELERDAAELSEKGWLRVKVPLVEPDPDINGKIRRLLPNAVSVEVEPLEVDEVKEEPRPPAGSPPRELYRAYHVRRYGEEPSLELMEAFDSLLESNE
jgi:exonuclease SbcD